MTKNIDNVITRKIPYLKSGVRCRTNLYFAAGVIIIAWLAFGRPISILSIQEIPLRTWLITVPLMMLSIITAAVESLPGPHLKAVLVFWQRKNPLPGSRAFDKANLDQDTRIDPEVLRKVVGGEFPRAPEDQNRTWYRLYKRFEHDTTVQKLHSDYLLFRDLAWLSIVLGVISLFVFFIVTFDEFVGLAVPGCAGLYLFFCRAATERGWRLVNQVLVNACMLPKEN